MTGRHPVLYIYSAQYPSMGMSKKDLSRKKANIKARIEELEQKARMDPLKKNRAVHDELEQLKKKLAEAD